MHRKDFPILKKVTYLDSAATMLKPKKVINAIKDFYFNFPVNPHSVDSSLGKKITKKIEQARKNCARLLHCSSEEIIFTSGTTDGINKLSSMCEKLLNPKSEILLSPFNHSSNLAPWIELAKKTKSKIVYSEKIIDKINTNTKIIAFSQLNNTLNVELNLDKIYQKARKVNALTVNDAAQAISHQKVSLDNSDVVVFSGNKLYGPTGIGVLAVKKKYLEKFKPTTFGGGPIANIKNLEIIFKNEQEKFEPGTINSAGVVGLNEAINYFDLKEVLIKEKELAHYAYEKLSEIKKIDLYSKKGDVIILFNVKNAHSHDVVSFLSKSNILTRSGKHCVNIDKKDSFFKKNPHLFLPPSIRVSLAFYNSKKDIDKLCLKIKNNKHFIV